MCESVLHFVEAVYSGRCGCGVGCAPEEIRIRVRSSSGSEMMLVRLTGKLNQHPMDTAVMQSKTGHIIAKFKW